MSSADARLHRPDPERPDHSDDLDTESEARSQVGTLRRLLGPVFGFLIWAIHFLTVYCSTAVACVLGLGQQSADAQRAFQLFQLAITTLAVIVVLLHALLALRRLPTADHAFLARITAGHDVLAAVGIAWMLFPILLEPVCR